MAEISRQHRFQVTPAVFVVILNKSNEVLLQRRSNTGYMDGYYDFPSGHLEAGETLQTGAARETLEEVGVDVEVADLELFHINQNAAKDELPYMNFMFRASAWSGQPRICEPDKCDDLAFFGLEHLPRITPQVRRALLDVDTAGTSFSYFRARDFELCG